MKERGVKRTNAKTNAIACMDKGIVIITPCHRPFDRSDSTAFNFELNFFYERATLLNYPWLTEFCSKIQLFHHLFLYFSQMTLLKIFVG